MFIIVVLGSCLSLLFLVLGMIIVIVLDMIRVLFLSDVLLDLTSFFSFSLFYSSFYLFLLLGEPHPQVPATPNRVLRKEALC